MISCSIISVGVIGVGHLGQHHARLYASLAGSVLAGVADAVDPAKVWGGLDLSRRRAIVEVLLDVVILRTGRGGPRRKGETVFDPESIEITWKR